MRKYSEFFTTVYNQKRPVGYLGRGTHYSIFSARVCDEVSNEEVTHTFCTIWDEDHDTRIVHVIETLMRFNLIRGVKFIGERKGCLSLILHDGFHPSQYTKVFGITGEDWDSPEGDYWTVHYNDLTMLIGIFNESKISLYLDTIEMLHDLGTKASPEQISKVDGIL